MPAHSRRFRPVLGAGLPAYLAGGGAGTLVPIGLGLSGAMVVVGLCMLACAYSQWGTGCCESFGLYFGAMRELSFKEFMALVLECIGDAFRVLLFCNCKVKV